MSLGQRHSGSKPPEIEDEEPTLADPSSFLSDGRPVPPKNGDVWRISPGEGSASLFTSLKQPVSLAPVVANQTLYILDDSGRITAFR